MAFLALFSTLLLAAPAVLAHGGDHSTSSTTTTAQAVTDSSSSHSGMSMPMAFTTTIYTPLYSLSWTPENVGQYAGSCIFLIILAIVGRALNAFKSTLERRWLQQALDRRYIVVADKNRISDDVRQSTDSKTAVLSVHGIEQEVRIATAPGGSIQPWRFSVDLPRGFLYMIIAAVSYLLMLAVMTFNVGYFLSVLGGTFIGEVALGRYINSLHSGH